MFFYFVPSNNVLGVFDVSMSIRLSHVQICSHLPKVMLWCEREILHAKKMLLTKEGTLMTAGFNLPLN
jgi:hypothetical protein